MNAKTKVLILSLFALLFPVLSAFSQSSEDWRDRVRNEKIAFFTAELDLSPSEAEKFWPLYNSYEAKRNEAFVKSMKAYKALEKAVEAGASEEELQKKLNEYRVAVQESHAFETPSWAEFKDVITVEKFAKLYVAEEKFRRNQIRRLHDNQASRTAAGRGRDSKPARGQEGGSGK